MCAFPFGRLVVKPKSVDLMLLHALHVLVGCSWPLLALPETHGTPVRDGDDGTLLIPMVRLWFVARASSDDNLPSTVNMRAR